MDLDQALIHAKKATGIQPLNPRAHYTLGTVLLKRGAWVEARAQLQKALRIEPNFAEARAALEDVLAQLGKAP